MSPKVEATERWWERKKTIRLPIWVEGNKLQGLYMLNFRVLCLFFFGGFKCPAGNDHISHLEKQENHRLKSAFKTGSVMGKHNRLLGGCVMIIPPFVCV